MALKIDSVNNYENKLLISGKSINNNSYFTTCIEWNASFEKITPNEGCFSVIIPKNDKLFKITTTLFSSRPSLFLENNIIIKKNELFNYKEYNIPSEVWLCVYGSIEGVI